MDPREDEREKGEVPEEVLHGGRKKAESGELDPWVLDYERKKQSWTNLTRHDLVERDENARRDRPPHRQLAPRTVDPAESDTKPHLGEEGGEG